MTVHAPTGSTLISLADSLDPLQRRFNDSAAKAQLVAIVSSTCGPCVAGAVGVNEAVVKAYPDADISMSIVWIDVLPSDCEATARHAAVIFDDPRVVQFYDPNQRAGAAFAEDLIRQPPAWDIYLFYAPGDSWEQRPPQPRDWAHQLRSAIADPSRLRTGAELASALHAAMIDLGYAPRSASPPDERALNEAGRSAMERIDQARRADSTLSADDAKQCSRCAAGGVSSCSLAGWRSIEAVAVNGDAPNGPQQVYIRGYTDSESAEAPAISSAEVVELHVSGLECADCMVSVAGALLGVRGVARVEITFDSGLARVTIQPPGSVDHVHLIESVRSAGYTATTTSVPKQAQASDE